jgi:hypothetical protein
MSYQITITFKKTTETPENAFSTIPIREPNENVTQAQITALDSAYPHQFEMRMIQDQLTITYTYNSKEDYDAVVNHAVTQDLRTRRLAWAELNKVTISTREV